MAEDQKPQHKPVRWGIIGSGLICKDFVGALKNLPPEEGQVVAIAARSLASAQRFADALEVPRACEGYDEVFSDPDIDVVYIGTVAQTHRELVERAIAAGKPVLVEKPMAMNAEEAAALVEKARAAGVFLMEGMWTRCFPAVAKVRELLDGGAIGDVISVHADFGWPADPYGEHKRLLDPLSGGVALDVAMYPLAHVLLGTGGQPPTKLHATGTVKEGVDWSIACALSWLGDRSVSATVLCTLDGSTPEEVVFTGKRGTLRIHRSAHTPTKLTLTVAKSRLESTEEIFEFPLPPLPAGALPFNYPNSQGFVYEAKAVHAALREGRLEPAEWTHSEAVTTLAMLDAIRKAVKEGCANSEPSLLVPAVAKRARYE